MSVYYVGDMPVSDELYHHGIKGQHWGIRRYQNPDGTLTAAGKARYGTVENFNRAQEMKKVKSSATEAQTRKEKIKRGAKIGLAVVGTGLAVYGGYKLHTLVSDKYRSDISSLGKRAIEALEGERQSALRSAKFWQRKSINSDFDRRKNTAIDYITKQKSTKQMYKNIARAIVNPRNVGR